MFIQQGKEPFSYPRWLNVGLKIALAFTGRKDLLIAFRTTLWNLFSKSKGAPHCLSPPHHHSHRHSRAHACFSVGRVPFSLSLIWCWVGVAAAERLVCFLLLLRDLCACLCHFQRSRWPQVHGNVVNRHQSRKPRISILSSKQLEVFEVLFGAYSSEPLCQRGIFIIKKKKLAVVHLAELNSKVIRVVYAFLIKSSLETDVRIKWYNTINIHGR